ncbi:hypothetical protein G6675_01985 [Polynucleobacter paneuropaeus]|nr:hypothetical protein [Polynucleobacter paneuropaeus]MBT8599716.1 hypothetical protein [Polynucleobacter paneuropaeus]
MIIGSGLIASSFLKYSTDISDAIIYAAGISNSQSINLNEYLRDRCALENTLERIDGNSLFVYISSCSIQGKEAPQESLYIKHKRDLEKLVMQRSNYIIFRLPQVAGFSRNPYTLLNYIYSSIMKKNVMNIKKNVYRNIIDVEDVTRIVTRIIKNYQVSSTINIANPESTHILDIISEMENILNKKALYKIVDGSDLFMIDTSIMKMFLDKNDILLNDKYLFKVLNKYYGQF